MITFFIISTIVSTGWDSLVRKTEESLPGTPTLEKKTSLNSIRETDHEASPFGDSQTDDSLSTTIRSRNSSASSSSLTASNSESRPKRPSFLDLSNGRGCPRKTQFTPPHEVDRSFPSPLGGNYPSADSLDSAPQLTSAHSDTPAFSHLQQGYQSVNLGALHPHEDSRLTNTTSDHNISSHDTDGPQQSGLLKWKGIVFTPEEEDTQSLEESLQQEGDREGSPQSHKPKVIVTTRQFCSRVLGKYFASIFRFLVPKRKLRINPLTQLGLQFFILRMNYMYVIKF